MEIEMALRLHYVGGTDNERAQVRAIVDAATRRFVSRIENDAKRRGVALDIVEAGSGAVDADDPRLPPMPAR